MKCILKLLSYHLSHLLLPVVYVPLSSKVIGHKEIIFLLLLIRRWCLLWLSVASLQCSGLNKSLLHLVSCLPGILIFHHITHLHFLLYHFAWNEEKSATFSLIVLFDVWSNFHDFAEQLWTLSVFWLQHSLLWIFVFLPDMFLVLTMIWCGFMFIGHQSPNFSKGS